MASRTLVAKSTGLPHCLISAPKRHERGEILPAIGDTNLGAQRTGNLKAHGDVLVCPARTEPVEHALMRVRGTPTRLASSMTRDADVADDTAASPTIRQRSLCRHRSRHGVAPKDRGIDKDYVGFATQNIKQ